MPPKKTEPAVASLASQMDAMSMTAKDDFILEGAHPRPDYGKTGQPVKAEANLYQVRLSSKEPGTGTVFHYDLDIARVVKTPSDKMPKNLTEKIWAGACRQEAGAPDKLAFETSAFDLGKNVYTVHQFKADSNGRQLVVGVPEEGRELDDRSRFKLTLKLANTVDLQSIMDFCNKNKQTLQIANTVLTAIQAGNILFRDDPSKKFHPMGARGKFFTMDGAEPISGGAVVAMGFYQSFRPASSTAPAIQLNNAFTAMFKPGNLLDLLPQLPGMGGGGGAPRGGGRGGRGGPRGGRGGGQMGGFGGHATIDQLNNYQIRSLSKLLWGAKFTLPYKKTSRFFTIKQISQAAAADIRFVMQGRDGAPSKDISIVDYFKEQFNITIRKPRLPCVVYGKNFMVPIELVHLAEFNAVPFAQLTGDQAAEMIKIAAQKPSDRSAAIKTWRARLNYQSITKIRQWGIEVAPNMMQVEGRVLLPPRVRYKGNKELGAINGASRSFTRPGTPLKAWGVVSLHNRANVQMTSKFINYLVGSLKQYGVNVANPTPDIMCPAQTGSQHLHNNLRLMCQTLATKHKIAPQLIIVILGDKDIATYQQIKNIAGMQLKMMFPTQCLLGKKILQDKGLNQYCGNVAMKIQAKLGGVTHEVPMTEVLTKTTIMIGADVTHPPPAGGGLLQPSIAVTVAGTDGENVRFSVGVRLQEGRVEIISDLANMVREHIETFQKKVGSKPDRILFFRDGVSEGQYMAVTKMEVEAVKKAAASFGDPKYRPKITFVVCAKRHNMRFFSMNQNDQDKNGNLKAGFVVDQRVTHPFTFDFYLQAHAGLQGTARPTHYIVLIDENGFKADHMQNFCNRLCYTYARATRAVSIVPVAYYADIIANQCRFLAYTDDSQGGSHSGPPKTRNYDPLAVAKRIGAVANVAWYM